MTALYPAETNSGVVTSWIPLTTAFTPEESCTSQFRLNGPSLVAFDPGYGLDIDTDAVCAPPAVTTWWEQGRLGHGADEGHTAASIGPLTCPDEWTTVATSVRAGSSTAIMCCPSGYTLNNGIKGSIAGNCLSGVDKGAMLTYASTPSTQSTSWRIATTTMAESSYVGAIAVVGWNVRVAAPKTTPTPAPTPSPSASVSSSPSSQSPPSSSLSPSAGPAITSSTANTTTNPVPSAGLSSGAAIGIGVGVALGVIGVVALLVSVFLMRRRKNKAAARAEFEQQLPLPSVPPREEPKRWSAHEVHELHPDGVKSELWTYRPPAELYGG